MLVIRIPAIVTDIQQQTVCQFPAISPTSHSYLSLFLAPLVGNKENVSGLQDSQLGASIQKGDRAGSILSATASLVPSPHPPFHPVPYHKWKKNGRELGSTCIVVCSLQQSCHVMIKLRTLTDQQYRLQWVVFTPAFCASNQLKPTLDLTHNLLLVVPSARWQ